MKASELNKLKVSDLQALLREKELPTSGKKDELIQRLLNSESEADAAKPSTDEAEPAAEPAAEAEEAENSNGTKDEPAEQAAEEAATSKEEKVEDKENGQAETPSQLEMSEAERRKLRAAKFGLPNDSAEQDKLKARAAKFGIADPKVQDDKIKAREDRFKGELQTVNQPKAGGKKGGTPAAAVSSEEEERRRKRAERFGVTSGTGAGAKAEPAASNPKLDERAKRFKTA